jgi:hypothetical protein
MTAHRFLAILLTLALLVTSGGVSAAHGPEAVSAESIAVIRQDCGGYPGPYPCFTSLADWQAGFGGIDFGENLAGDLVAVDKIAIAQIEGTWTQADTTPVDITGWTTDASHYIRIFTTAEARHHGTPGSGYRLEILTADQPIYTTAAYLRIEGLEIYSHSAYTGHLVYLNPNTIEGVGEIEFSSNLIHGDGIHPGSGLMNYTCRGTFKAWNNIIYDVGTPGYTAGIQTGAGTSYLYNNTIVDIIDGFGIRTAGVVIAKNNLTDAPGEDFYGSFYPGSDFNASEDDSAPGFHSRLNQAFTFTDQAGDDFHLAAADIGARNYALDLSNDPALAFAGDLDGDSRSGGWDIGADETASGTDIVPPIRLNGAPSGTLPSDTTQATLSLDTHEASTCRYAASAGVAYGNMVETFSETGYLTHTQQITSLHDEQTYTYYVKCQDSTGNPDPDDYPISFYIDSADVVPPVISVILVNPITPYSADVTWTTDEPATSQVEYGLATDYGAFSIMDTQRTVTHTLRLRGLDPQTTYHFRVRSVDIGDNEIASGDSSFTTTALGPIYYVNQNEPGASDSNPGTLNLPWLTIQHAADVAQPGDTILVYPGDYERVTIRNGGTVGHYITYKGLNLPDQSLVDPDAHFDPANPVQIPGNPAVNAVTKGFALTPAYGSGVTIRYVHIENFEITAIGAANGRGGVQLSTTESIEIVRNFIHDLNPDPAGYDYIGIRGENQNNANTLIKDNTLYRVQGTGINVVGTNWLVEGNEVSHSLDANTDTGLEVGGDSDAMRFFGSGHVIRNNYLHDNLDTEQYGSPHIDCFQTFSVYPESQYADHILIEGNTCDNMGQMLMIEDSSEINGTGNAVHHITFRNNIFRRARANAINGSRADYFTFVNNVIAESYYSGWGLVENPYQTVYNNIFYNNSSGSQINDNASKIGSVWDYNIHYPDFSWPPKQPEYDRHSSFGIGPRFQDPYLGDYHLRVDSPAIDRGMALNGFNYDMEGILRPQITAWDIGAYEIVPQVALTGISGDQCIHLTWAVNLILPVTVTWKIDYSGPTGDQPSPITGIASDNRAYTMTGLTNYTWYDVTMTAVGASPVLSDTVRLMPTDVQVYLPVIRR